MSKKLWVPLASLAGVVFLIAFGPKTFAFAQFRSGGNQTVSAGETIDSTLFTFGKNIEVAGTVNGDVFCGGQTINISGTIKGDVICAGQNVTVSGKVEGNVRLAGQNVYINGEVAKNATAAAQTVNTDSKSRIGGDASFGSSDQNLNGNIGRDLSAGSGTVNLQGNVGRDIKGSTGQLNLNGSAKIGGNIDYTSHNQLYRSSDTAVAGSVVQHIPKEHSKNVRFGMFAGIFALILALMLLLKSLVVTLLFPQLVHGVTNKGMTRPWLPVLIGFAGGILIPVAAVVMMATVVGIPLGILTLLIYALLGLTSGIFTSYWVGRKILKNSNSILRVFVGALILLVGIMIPYLGFFVILFTIWMGAGMSIMSIKSSLKKPAYNLN